MMPVTPLQDGAEVLMFRMDAHPPRLTVTASEDFGLEAIGYEVMSATHLDELVAAVERIGLPIDEGSKVGCEEREVTRFVATTDPGGVPIELYYGPKLTGSQLITPLVSGFVTGDDVGMGHVVIRVPNGQETYDFYTQTLGFTERNTMRHQGRTTWFLGPNHRQHTLALTSSDSFRFGHFMVEMETIDDVGRALDRVLAAGMPLWRSLGRHTNDQMLSFYVQAPDEFSVEIGCDGLLVTHPRPTYEMASPSDWGHHPSAPA